MGGGWLEFTTKRRSMRRCYDGSGSGGRAPLAAEVPYLLASVTRAEFKSQNQNKYQYEAYHARYKNYDNYKLKQPSEQLTPGPLICYKRSKHSSTCKTKGHKETTQRIIYDIILFLH